MKPLLVFLLFSLSSISFAQSEYQYYENLRLERQKNNIKSISHFEGDNNNPYEIEYFSVDGNPSKFESYTSEYKLYILVEITNISKNGLVSYTQTNNLSSSSPLQFSSENIKISELYDIGFGDNTITDVKYIFDSKYFLIEKKYFAEDFDLNIPLTNEKYFYNNEGKLNMSKLFDSDNSLTSTAYYFYNSQGLAEKITHKDSNSYTIIKYEFY
ncbi:MAG TPA: hypothetical protein VIL99_17475 [Ignavibacteria bacterium]